MSEVQTVDENQETLHQNDTNMKNSFNTSKPQSNGRNKTVFPDDKVDQAVGSPANNANTNCN